MIERIDVGFSDVGYVDVIADAGAVRRVKVVAKDRYTRAQSDGRFGSDLDQMGCNRSCLSAPHLGVGTGNIEIA